MEEGSIDNALERIEKAIDRIDGAASRASPANTDLEQRHERLVASVASALGELDELIESRSR